MCIYLAHVFFNIIIISLHMLKNISDNQSKKQNAKSTMLLPQHIIAVLNPQFHFMCSFHLAQYNFYNIDLFNLVRKCSQSCRNCIKYFCTQPN